MTYILRIVLACSLILSLLASQELSSSALVQADYLIKAGKLDKKYNHYVVEINSIEVLKVSGIHDINKTISDYKNLEKKYPYNTRIKNELCKLLTESKNKESSKYCLLVDLPVNELDTAIDAKLYSKLKQLKEVKNTFDMVELANSEIKELDSLIDNLKSSKTALAKVICASENVYRITKGIARDHMINSCKYLISTEVKEKYYKILASIYGISNDDNKAIDVYKEARKIFPKNTKIICSLAEHEYMDRRFIDAEETAKYGLKLDTNINCALQYFRTLVVQNKEFDYELFNKLDIKDDKADIYKKTIMILKVLFDISKGNDINYRNTERVSRLLYDENLYRWVLLWTKNNNDQKLKEAFLYLYKMR